MVSNLNLLDGIFLFILAFSIILAFWKGFVAQAISLAGWVVALVAARTFGEEVAPLFESVISDPGLQLAAAYVAIAVVVLILARVASSLIGGLIKKIGLGQIDRFLGLIFGGLRGLMIIVLGVAIASLTDLREHQLWQESQLMPYMEQVRDFSAAHLDAYMQKAQEEQAD